MPKLTARFKMGPDGNVPLCIKGKGGLEHYKIEFSVVNAPKDTVAVTYTLDDSYYEPVREAISAKDDFSVETTSYGDYALTAEVLVGGKTIKLKGVLSKLLKQSHAAAASEDVKKAIDSIKAR